MVMKRTKTYSLKQGEIYKAWHVIDADGQTLGRLATRVAMLLMGKHKPSYVPYLDMGDFVIVVNAERCVSPATNWKTRFTTDTQGILVVSRRLRWPRCCSASRTR